MNKNVSFILAFTSGLLSFLSPCVLPLFPAYISYLTGSTIAELNSGKARLSALYKAIGFVIGFSIVFIIMGISASFLGKFLNENIDIFRRIGGILIIVFGIHMTGIFKIKLLYFEKSAISFVGNKRNIGSVFMGMAFALGWTPCIGPILASILIYAGSMETIAQGVLLLSVYSLGLAIPFIFTALAIGSFSKYFKRLSKYLPAVSIISGIILIAMGVIVFFQ